MVVVTVFGLMAVSCASKGSQLSHRSKVDKRLDELQRSLEHSSAQMESLRNDVLILQDQMESTRLLLQKVAHHQNSGGKLKLGSKRKAPKPFIQIISSKTDPVAKPLKTDDGKPIESPMNMYREAFKAYENRQYNDAIEQFEQFVRRYSNHDYADNAVYWMGEAYYGQKEYLLAATEFRRVLDQYPGSNKEADSLLKIGLCYQNLADPAKAQSTYESILKQYPYAEAAKKAAVLLAQLKEG